MNKRLCKKYSIVSKVLYHCKITKCIFDCFYLFWCRMFPRLFQFFYRIRSIIHRQSQISLYLCDICGMYLEAVFRFYILLNHFVGHFFFGLVRFGSFSNTIYRNLALALSKLHINVDITVGFFVGQKNYRLNEDVVLSLISDMLKAIAEYAKHDRSEFIRVVQEAQSSQQTAEVRKQRTRLATAKQRVSELEVLLCKIYEDNILGKLSDSRYEMLDAQYAKEQGELTAEIFALEKAVKGYEKHEKDADRFIALVDKYENFDTLTVTMLNEFVEKILVHERDRKGSRDTTQEVEIYFNFVGRFVPPAFGEVELTPEELEEIRKKEERKDRLHQNYLKRKANGKQKEYEERTKAKKKAEIEARKAAIRTEDIAKGVFIPVSSLPQREPQKGAKTA